MQVSICPIENSWGHGWPKAFIKNSFVCSTFDSGNVLCEKVGFPPFATWNEHSFFSLSPQLSFSSSHLH